MQLTNSATIVDFFPEAFIAEACEKKGMKVVIKRFVKRVTFRANDMKSYSTVLATDAEYEWNCRIAKGAEVTDFNTDKMPSSEYASLLLILSFISFPTDPNTMNREQLDLFKANYASLIVDGMDVRTLEQLAMEMVRRT